MSVAAFIADQKTGHDVPHAVACRALGVSQSWFCKWKRRIGVQAPTGRQRRRAELDTAIRRSFEASGGTYGSPRITDDLREEGWRVSENTVAARMAEHVAEHITVTYFHPVWPMSSTRSSGVTSARTASPRRWDTLAIGWTSGGTVRVRPR